MKTSIGECIQTNVPQWWKFVSKGRLQQDYIEGAPLLPQYLPGYHAHRKYFCLQPKLCLSN